MAKAPYPAGSPFPFSVRRTFRHAVVSMSEFEVLCKSGIEIKLLPDPKLRLDYEAELPYSSSEDTKKGKRVDPFSRIQYRLMTEPGKKGYLDKLKYVQDTDTPDFAKIIPFDPSGTREKEECENGNYRCKGPDPKPAGKWAWLFCHWECRLLVRPEKKSPTADSTEVCAEVC